MQDQLKILKEKIKSYGLNRENIKDLKKWILNDLDLPHLILDCFLV